MNSFKRISFMDKKLLEYVADLSLLFIALIWGSTFIIIKEVVVKIDPLNFISYRFIVASVAIFPFVIIKKKLFCYESVKAGIILGVVMFSFFYFQTVALEYISASLTSFLTGLYIIFVPLLSIFVLRKKPYPTSVLAVIVSSLGLYIMSNGFKFQSEIGELFALLNAFFLAVHIILTDYYTRKFHPLALTAVQIFFTAAISTLFAASRKNFFTDFSLDFETIFALVLTGVFATVLAFFIQTKMQKYTTPTKAAILFTLEPVSGAFFGYLIGNEILFKKQYIGACFIIFAMIISEIGSAILKRKKG
jgi:drug/metabolite transporter (DMT)-like permease